MVERPATEIIKGTTISRETHFKVRIEGNEYCSDCGSWNGAECTRNPHNIIDEPEFMPGCRFFTVNDIIVSLSTNNMENEGVA